MEILRDIKFVYFDIGNVFFSFKNGLETMASKMNATLEDVTEFWKRNDDNICRGKLAPQDFWKLCINNFGYKGPDLDFVQFWVEHFVKINSGHELATKISRNSQVGLITNIYPGVFEKISQNGLIPNLKWASVIQSCDYGFVKPERELFDIASAKTGFKKREILLIDDISKNCQKAEEYGWKSLVFKED